MNSEVNQQERNENLEMFSPKNQLEGKQVLTANSIALMKTYATGSDLKLFQSMQMGGTVTQNHYQGSRRSSRKSEMMSTLPKACKSPLMSMLRKSTRDFLFDVKLNEIKDDSDVLSRNSLKELAIDSIEPVYQHYAFNEHEIMSPSNKSMAGFNQADQIWGYNNTTSVDHGKKSGNALDYDSNLSTTLDSNKQSIGPTARKAWQSGIHDMEGEHAFEWERMIKRILKNDLFDRESVRTSSFRFMLPLDLKKLEALTPMKYLQNYVNISPQKKALYQLTFQKHRQNKKDPVIIYKKLYGAINEILLGTLTEEQFNEIKELVCLKETDSTTQQEYFGLCTLAERLFFIKNLTGATEEAQQTQKGFLEKADFHNILAKIASVKTSQHLCKLLITL